MKLNRKLDLNDKLKLDDETVVSITTIYDTRFGTSDEYKNRPHLRHLRYRAEPVGENPDNIYYQFIVFEDGTVSKLTKLQMRNK